MKLINSKRFLGVSHFEAGKFLCLSTADVSHLERN